MTTVDDLAAWLTQVWDVDVKVAEEAIDSKYEGGGWYAQRFGETLLAQIETDRQILAEHATIDPGEDWAHCRRCQDHERHDVMRAPCRTVRLLAVRHADRPGYREEWRP